MTKKQQDRAATVACKAELARLKKKREQLDAQFKGLGNLVWKMYEDIVHTQGEPHEVGYARHKIVHPNGSFVLLVVNGNTLADVIEEAIKEVFDVDTARPPIEAELNIKAVKRT